LNIKADQLVEFESVYKEIFADLRPNRFSKLYTSVDLIRKIIFISWLISLQTVTMKVTVGVYSALQLAYCITLVAIRPFQAVKDNFVVFLNELFYLF
jgi:hypothetical protein